MSPQPNLDVTKLLVQNLVNSSGNLLKEIFSWQHLSSWQLYVFLYLVFAMGTSITLSLPDIKGALGGFIVVVVLLLIANLVTVWVGNYLSNVIIRIAGYSAMFYAMVGLIILLNVAVVLLILLPLSIIRGKRSKSA